jgi:hypothetical protein
VCAKFLFTTHYPEFTKKTLNTLITLQVDYNKLSLMFFNLKTLYLSMTMNFTYIFSNLKTALPDNPLGEVRFLLAEGRPMEMIGNSGLCCLDASLCNII